MFPDAEKLFGNKDGGGGGGGTAGPGATGDKSGDGGKQGGIGDAQTPSPGSMAQVVQTAGKTTTTPTTTTQGLLALNEVNGKLEEGKAGGDDAARAP